MEFGIKYISSIWNLAIYLLYLHLIQKRIIENNFWNIGNVNFFVSIPSIFSSFYYSHIFKLWWDCLNSKILLYLLSTCVSSLTYCSAYSSFKSLHNSKITTLRKMILNVPNRHIYNCNKNFALRILKNVQFKNSIDRKQRLFLDYQ